jgi:hypothetical protein
MGIARLALAALAVVAFLVIGGRALLGSFGAQPEQPVTTPEATASDAQVPTVRIECVADTCPLVTVRVPGGDVLQHGEMSGGEEVSYFEPELAVVLTDAGTVRVTENGRPRALGEKGVRDSFTVKNAAG